jgi:hypothetical protein
VSGNLAALVIICGAAVLTGWLGARFPRLAPSGFVEAGLHMICSMVAVNLGMRVLGAVPDEPVAVMAALFGAALPTTIYLLLSAFWLLKLMHGLTGRACR